VFCRFSSTDGGKQKHIYCGCQGYEDICAHSGLAISEIETVKEEDLPSVLMSPVEAPVKVINKKQGMKIEWKKQT
jgi:hypothetical protein